MAALEPFEDLVREKVEKERWSHQKLSDYMKSLYPEENGFSVRSIQRFCGEKVIHKTSRLSEPCIDVAVSEAITKVGPTYGRKTMTGLLASQGMRVSEQRVGESLGRVNPSYQHARRTSTSRHMNPVPYHADYFGHKLHVDQNEKLVMFGVTHICAIDGYSGKIVSFVSMPVKNNVEIYEHLYRPIVQQYGLWDQIRIDHGKEWYLMLFIQEQVAHLRHNTNRAPHLQTTSKMNHCVERIWVEINSRVNYPIKSCLVTLQERADIDLDCPHQCFCVSWFTIRVAKVGTVMAVESWNNHPIPGAHRGVPNEIMNRNNSTVTIDSQLLPRPDDAVRLYESHGGHLTQLSPFGCDPLNSRVDLVSQRESEFQTQFPDFGRFFYTVVNGDCTQFRDGILCLIDISKRLESQL